MIAIYKRIRSTVQTGNLYRLSSPRTADVTANEYVSSDGKQAVLFAFRHSQQYNTPAPTIRLRGLDERAVLPSRVRRRKTDRETNGAKRRLPYE